MTTRLVRRVTLALAFAGAIAVTAYFTWRPACESEAAARRGDATRTASGTLVYFDGECWTTKPLPAEDQPFSP